MVISQSIACEKWMVMLQEMACPTVCSESRLVRRLVQLAQLSQVHLKNGHAPRNGLCFMACPGNRLVRRLVQLVVINYFGVDRPVMTLVCVLVLKRTPTLRTPDHRPLSVPNIVMFVATTPRCNPIFVVWIANEVADINS